jgi:hypothetical protein
MNAQPWPPLFAAGLPLPENSGLPMRADCDGATADGLPLLTPAGEPRFCDDAGAGWTDTGATGAGFDSAGAGTEELWESCELWEE